MQTFERRGLRPQSPKTAPPFRISGNAPASYSKIWVKRCKQGWQYGTVCSEFAYYVPHTLNRTSVPYFSSIFEAYRTNVPYPHHYEKGVPYFLAKIEAYCTVLTYHTIPYCHLAFNYSQLHLNLISLAYKSAISIHTFSVRFRCLLPLHTKSPRNVRKVWDF